MLPSSVCILAAMQWDCFQTSIAQWALWGFVWVLLALGFYRGRYRRRGIMVLDRIYLQLPAFHQTAIDWIHPRTQGLHGYVNMQHRQVHPSPIQRELYTMNLMIGPLNWMKPCHMSRKTRGRRHGKERVLRHHLFNASEMHRLWQRVSSNHCIGWHNAD